MSAKVASMDSGPARVKAVFASTGDVIACAGEAGWNQSVQAVLRECLAHQVQLRPNYLVMLDPDGSIAKFPSTSDGSAAFDVFFFCRKPVAVSRSLFPPLQPFDASAAITPSSDAVPDLLKGTPLASVAPLLRRDRDLLRAYATATTDLVNAIATDAEACRSMCAAHAALRAHVVDSLEPALRECRHLLTSFDSFEARASEVLAQHSAAVERLADTPLASGFGAVRVAASTLRGVSLGGSSQGASGEGPAADGVRWDATPRAVVIEPTKDVGREGTGGEGSAHDARDGDGNGNKQAPRDGTGDGDGGGIGSGGGGGDAVEDGEDGPPLAVDGEGHGHASPRLGEASGAGGADASGGNDSSGGGDGDEVAVVGPSGAADVGAKGATDEDTSALNATSVKGLRSSTSTGSMARSAHTAMAAASEATSLLAATDPSWLHSWATRCDGELRLLTLRIESLRLTVGAVDTALEGGDAAAALSAAGADDDVGASVSPMMSPGADSVDGSVVSTQPPTFVNSAAPVSPGIAANSRASGDTASAHGSDTPTAPVADAPRTSATAAVSGGGLRSIAAQVALPLSEALFAPLCESAEEAAAAMAGEGERVGALAVAAAADFAALLESHDTSADAAAEALAKASAHAASTATAARAMIKAQASYATSTAARASAVAAVAALERSAVAAADLSRQVRRRVSLYRSAIATLERHIDSLARAHRRPDAYAAGLIEYVRRAKHAAVVAARAAELQAEFEAMATKEAALRAAYIDEYGDYVRDLLPALGDKGPQVHVSVRSASGTHYAAPSIDARDMAVIHAARRVKALELDERVSALSDVADGVLAAAPADGTAPSLAVSDDE